MKLAVAIVLAGGVAVSAVFFLKFFLLSFKFLGQSKLISRSMKLILLPVPNKDYSFFIDSPYLLYFKIYHIFFFSTPHEYIGCVSMPFYKQFSHLNIIKMGKKLDSKVDPRTVRLIYVH